MIHTSRQLKALVRNISKGDSTKARIIIRSYVMERFLECLSLSQYRNNIILKGGTLVAAMVGLDSRSTMDVDATLKEAFVNTSEKRGSIGLLSDVHLILEEIAVSTVLIDRWKNYQRKFDYAADVPWKDVMESIRCLIDIVK